MSNVPHDWNPDEPIEATEEGWADYDRWLVEQDEKRLADLETRRECDPEDF